MDALNRVRVRAGDFALVLAALGVMVLGTINIHLPSPPPDALGWSLLVIAGGALWFRRTRPVHVMWVVIAAGLIYDILGNPGAFSTVAIVIAIHSVASLGHRWTAVSGIAASLGLSYLGDLMFDTGHVLDFEGVLWFGGWLTAGLLMGEVSRDRVVRAAANEQRARDAERHRREETLRRAGEERMRIAREVHDVLAHSISIINVQAGVAAHHFDTDPDKARAALDTVRNAGKDALRELRASLGVLRDSDADSEAPREPSPGIRDVDQLVAGIEETGLTVHLERVGNPETVPADVGLAVYRVIQESLTNVSRHARASEVQVTIDRRPQEVLVRIEDNGVGFVGSTPDGHGIVGMRERLRLLGGHLDVGPAQNGEGLAVEGHIPLGEDR